MTVDQASRLQHILNGICSELDAQPKHLSAEVRRCSFEDNCLKVFIKPERNSGCISCEELEGTLVEWVGLPPGGITVLNASLEFGNEHIVVEGKPPVLPAVGEKIKLQLPQYLKTLYACWENSTWSQTCLHWLEQLKHVSASNIFHQNQVPDSLVFPWLRRRQKDAFQLSGWNIGFLFGPPGTGKTTCGGAMAAQYLAQFPGSRILLISTTNQAVDQALIAVDKSLEELGQTNPTAQDIRFACARFGNRYARSLYQGKTHLFPGTPGRQVLLATGERIQAGPIQNTLEKARLTAMTATRAVNVLSELQSQNFNLLVIDEASQVGLAYAAALAPLAQKVVFAGDPKQLSPVVKSSSPAAKLWVGTSVFSCAEETAEWACCLNEQARMAEPICRLVSEMSYGGRLVVAEDCAENLEWEKARQLEAVEPIGTQSVCIAPIAGKAIWSQKYSGPIRQRSVEFICDLARKITLQISEREILIVTPFRAQQRLIEETLKGIGLKKVRVSTVHRAQSSEFHTVIFDPVDGTNGFLQTPETKKLINVALSRAKARLVITLSKSDLRNPLLLQMSSIVERLQFSSISQDLSIHHQASRDTLKAG